MPLTTISTSLRNEKAELLVCNYMSEDDSIVPVTYE